MLLKTLVITGRNKFFFVVSSEFCKFVFLVVGMQAC